MTVSRTKIADTLEAAVEIGDTYGWCQGSLEIDNEDDAEDQGAPVGSHCAVGCIRAALHLPWPMNNPTERATMKALAVHLGMDPDFKAKPGRIQADPVMDYITDWNDTDDQKWGHVRDAMLHTAKEMRNA